MIVAVASGKGGTGKTTVAASLVSVWDAPVAAVDLDVEAPNLHLFLRPEIEERRSIRLEVPVPDESRCTLCGTCSDICQFGAVTILGETLLVFPEMCHGCGGCLAACPESALSPGFRSLGLMESGMAGNALFLSGRLRVGEAMSPPLMRAVKDRLAWALAAQPMDAVLDAPPGVSCPAVTAVLDVDAILMVTEPTPFGFHDFALAWEAFAPMGKPMAVVVNRAGLGDEQVAEFCRDKQLPILAEIPYSRAVAEAYSNGCLAVDAAPGMRETFESVRDGLRRMAGEAAHA
jgi:MinD superfamily P-loop ATPase